MSVKLQAELVFVDKLSVSSDAVDIKINSAKQLATTKHHTCSPHISALTDINIQFDNDSGTYHPYRKDDYCFVCHSSCVDSCYNNQGCQTCDGKCYSSCHACYDTCNGGTTCQTCNKQCYTCTGSCYSCNSCQTGCLVICQGCNTTCATCPHQCANSCYDSYSCPGYGVKEFNNDYRR